MTDQRAAIVGAGRTALAALIDQKDAGATLAHATLSDLARLERALTELLPIIRQVILEGERAFADQAADDVPRVGPIAACAAAVVHQVLVYGRDSRGGLTCDWAVSSCPGHVLAHIRRAQHATGDRAGQTSVTILPLPLAENAQCGRTTDFNRG